MPELLSHTLAALPRPDLASRRFKANPYVLCPSARRGAGVPLHLAHTRQTRRLGGQPLRRCAVGPQRSTAEAEGLKAEVD
jgi:hypothetical protein